MSHSHVDSKIGYKMMEQDTLFCYIKQISFQEHLNLQRKEKYSGLIEKILMVQI